MSKKHGRKLESSLTCSDVHVTMDNDTADFTAYNFSYFSISTTYDYSKYILGLKLLLRSALVILNPQRVEIDSSRGNDE
jgi:hypothetical protein